MKRTWTIIGVADVARSCKWYQSLFGQPETKRTRSRTTGCVRTASGGRLRMRLADAA